MLGNSSNSTVGGDLPESALYLLLIALVVAMAWTVYLVYYNSRILGLILTAILNKFVKYGHIKFGSFSFSVLSGKIMFRDVHLVTEDYSVRVQYAWAIFRWWRPYVYKELNEDLSHCDTRVSLFLDGFEFHLYNRSYNYAKLEKLFGLEPDMIPKDESQEESVSVVTSRGTPHWHWRDLVPVIKVDINTGRVVFGNHLLPTTLTINFEEAHMVYTTKPASTPFDQFMHVTKCRAENVRIMMVPSPKYNGPSDVAPRYMGEGFVVLQSNDVEIYFYMDEPGSYSFYTELAAADSKYLEFSAPHISKVFFYCEGKCLGLVPHEPELVHLADGEAVVRRTYPCLGMDVKCGKNTHFNYGPWADRQREHLWKFFYPADYMPLVPTKIASPGETRQFKAFEFRMNIIADTMIDILFTKNSVNQAVHMNCGQGSYIEANIPWIIEENGYMTKVTGQLLLLEATTSLKFRSLVDCETLEFSINASYPLVWNAHQEWHCDFTACKATVSLIFQLKNFFTYMSDDWASKSVPDLYHFIPYTCYFNLIIKEFELVLLANQYNWIDTSSQHQENVYVAFCGEMFDLSLQLPFTDFLPATVPVGIFIRGECVDCRLYLPENDTSRHVVLTLAENSKITDREGKVMDKPFGFQEEKQWRNSTESSAGWIDCWKTPIVALNIGYTYHPIPWLGEMWHGVNYDNVGSAELEEVLLIPLRPSHSNMFCSKPPDDFHPTSMKCDLISVELEVGPSVMCLYGSLLRSLINTKENYFGENQHFTDLYEAPLGEEDSEVANFQPLNTTDEQQRPFDSRKYRPLSVTVSVTLHDIQAHLVKNCNVDDIPCPCIYLERLGFEMDKSYLETKLQLLLSPAVLLAKDTVEREADQAHLQEGHLGLSGLQVRGHAMFSDEALPLGSETMEYAWLMEAIIGNITGKLTSPQVQNIVEFLETFIMLVNDAENMLQRTVPYRTCQHGLPQSQCRMLPQYPFCCPSPDDIKYRMTRVSVDSINLHFVESGSDLNLQVFPIRVSTCNLHGLTTRAGVTGLLEQISLKQYISTASMRHSNSGQPEIWLESGEISLGPINVEAAMALPNSEFHRIQDNFLKSHDSRTHRLWFLWPPNVVKVMTCVMKKCGCLGGCKFFGNNKNGVGFFQPRRYSAGNLNAAVFQVFPGDADPGFGQSLLCRDKLMFDVSTTNPVSPEVHRGLIFTRGYMSNLTTPETPMTNVTLIDEIQKLNSSGLSNFDSVTLNGENFNEKDESRYEMAASSIYSGDMHSSDILTGFQSKDLLQENNWDTTTLFKSGTISGPESLTSLPEEADMEISMNPQKNEPMFLRQSSFTTSSTGSVYSYPSSPSSAYARDSRHWAPGANVGAGSPTKYHPWSSPETGRSRCTSGDFSQTMTSVTSVESDRYFTAEEEGILSDSEAQRKLLKKCLVREVNSSMDMSSSTLTGEVERNFEHSTRSKKRPRESLSSASSSSTLSFMSAISSPGDVTNMLPDDLSLVDLHGQMNKPITKSPVLMSCYLNHLTQLQCNDWSAPSPFPHTLKVGSLKGMRHDHSFYSYSSMTYAPSGSCPKPSWIPHFAKVKQGFTTGIMKEREEHEVPSTPVNEGPSDPWELLTEDHENADTAETILHENMSKTTAMVRLKGSIDIILTPLLLESIQRCIEAVIPTVATLHPSAILDGLHCRCLDRLKQKNRLTEQKLCEDEENLVPESSKTGKLPLETKTSSFQAYFSLSKINICILQSSIVEEQVSFSALDNIHDFTCVSLLAICVDSIECQLLSNCHSCTITQETSPASTLQHTAVPPMTEKTKIEPSNVDNLKVTETSKDENVGTLHISKIHLQLRRLLKNSNYSDNVILTAIPESRSKVLFTFDKDGFPCESKQSTLSRDSSQTHSSSKERQRDEDLGIGFIMFECGLEGIHLTAVRRLGFKEATDTEFQHKMEQIEKTLEQMQEITKSELDGEETNSGCPHGKSCTDSKASASTGDECFPSLENLMKISPLEGDASSGVLQLDLVWFNFAAPPSLSVRKKMDFTRLDWNLLSTATPAINAWMNPCDHLVVAIRQMRDVLTQRMCSVMACIMTEALEVQSIHMPYKSKFNKITPLSKILQEDPSCQLFTVLRKFLKRAQSMKPIEQAVMSDTIPQLITIQKGILALTRQWKNFLYMPHLADMNFKLKKQVKPFTVAFALPVVESSDNLDIDDGEGPVEHFDVVDERTSLLQAEGGSIHQSLSVPSLSGHSLQVLQHHHHRGPTIITSCIDGAADVVVSSALPCSRTKKISTVFSGVGTHARSGKPPTVSADFGDANEQEFATKPTLLESLPITRNESSYSFISMAGSMSSNEMPLGNTPPSTPIPIRKTASKNTDNLYEWMAQQQENRRHNFDGLYDSAQRQDSIITAFASNFGREESKVEMNSDQLMIATSILQLADAQMLFKPFLQSIGLHVEGVRTSAVMKRFGGHLSLQGRLDFLKIQIAQSADSFSKDKVKPRSTRGHQKFPKVVNTKADIPAFLCDGFIANIGMKDVVDFEKNKGKNERKLVSWKFAMHKLEAKPTTLKVNFMMICHAVTQHVDMPLLRLIHQFVTMIDNVNETRVELKQNRPDMDWHKTHHKQDSKDSTSSADTQQSQQSKQLTAETDTPTPDASLHSDVSSQDDHKAAIKAIKSRSQGTLECKRPDRLPLMSLRRTHLRFSGKKNKSGSKSQTAVLTPPQSLNLSDSVTLDIADTSSPVFAEKTIVDEIKESTPRCWRTLYHLLELYSTMPTTKTLARKSMVLPAIEEEPEKESGSRSDVKSTPDDVGSNLKTKIDVAGAEEAGVGTQNKSVIDRNTFKQSIYIGESIPLVVFGIAKVQKLRILAALSGLKLEAEMRCVHASGAYREKVKGFVGKRSSESSVTAHVGHTHIALLEGIPPSMTTVVTVDFGKSQGLYTSVVRRGKKHNSALISIGAIDVNIPQHPVVLHGMMARSSKQLSSTLREFRWTAAKASRIAADSSEFTNQELTTMEKIAPKQVSEKSGEAGSKMKNVILHVHFKAVLQGLTIGASLLPSLRAQHKTSPITVTGMTGKKARFTINLPGHTLSFKSQIDTAEATIPSSASIDLPPINVYADYRHHKTSVPASEVLTEGLVLKEGSYLNAVAEVGMLEHSLTTDLLNHVVFVQKVFMKEVNELVQKVSGSDQPVRIWMDEGKAVSKLREPILYSLLFRLKGIQITATTPTSNAVRLETGSIDLEISNRVQLASHENTEFVCENNQKVFVRAHIDLNVSLGQLLKNALFEEAEPEFQTVAYFKTNIGIRNALQDEMIPGQGEDQEALLITLRRPIVLAQPMAFDKAVLVWLNYRNAYEYWTEQRMALNREVQTATQQVIDKLPQLAPATHTNLSTLFLQLTVDDMGICVPVHYFSQDGTQNINRMIDIDPGTALVLTVESTQISACSSGSLVSKGKFTGFCLRFADDFQTSWDDWKPDSKEGDPIMNACVVPQGTYEVCSRTINKQTSAPNSNAKWVLNVLWLMEGIDVHLDTNIGKKLSALGHTLTSLAGDPSVENAVEILNDGDCIQDCLLSKQSSWNQNEVPQRRQTIVADSLPAFVFDSNLEPKVRARLIEKEMNEQARIVQDLKQLGASHSTIEAEIRKLEGLQVLVFNDFRRDVLNKLKKQSERASVIKDTLGLGNKTSHLRSKSFGGHHSRKHISLCESEKLPTNNEEDSPETSSLDAASSRVSRPFDYSLSSSPDFQDTTSAAHSFRTPDITSVPHSPQKPLDLCSLSSSEISLSSDEDNNHLSLAGKESFMPLLASSEDNVLEEDDRMVQMQSVSSSGTPSGGSAKAAASDPSVDFELDFKVFIDSGKCVLHPKESKDDELRKVQKKETSPSILRRKMKRQDSSSTLLTGKKCVQIHQSHIENTVFFLPSLDVKVHYNSKTSSADSLATPYIPSSASVHSDMDSLHVPSSRKTGVKKANLYAWILLQSLPEEMVISPCLLDFLEQAMEPLPMSHSTQAKKAELMDSVLTMDLDASTASLGLPVSYTSFPVDVVVFIRVESSIIRFNCVPMSRVECLLQVPSLETVFSTRGTDEGITGEGTPPLKTKVPKWSTCGSRERNLSGNQGMASSRPRLSSTTSDHNAIMSTLGGLSFTGCLSDFSLYIFHPYGGGQRKSTVGSPGYPGGFPKSDLGSIQEHGANILTEFARKDSLSLNVEFIKLNISRSRKLDIRLGDNQPGQAATTSVKQEQVKSNVVRFSAVCDIGTASFKYDMRRLSEILSFPKAWYRRNLARRLFLGDDSMMQVASDEDLPRSPSSSSVASESAHLSGVVRSLTLPALHSCSRHYTHGYRTHHRRVSSGDKWMCQVSQELQAEINRSSKKGTSSPQSPIDVNASESGGAALLPKSSQPKTKSGLGQYFSPEVSRHRNNSGHQASGVSSSWETLVLFAVNLARLDVSVNMTNVMGNTTWSTRDIKCQGCLSIDSFGHKNMKITAGLGASMLDSKGGVVGGTIDLQDLHTFFDVHEDPELGKAPDHQAGLSLFAMEARLDYMGSSVLMTRISSLALHLKDEWLLDKEIKPDIPLATKRPAILFAHGTLDWEQFHMMISRSTTPDLVKMVAKLEEFFIMYLTSSKRVLSAFGPISGSIKNKFVSKHKNSDGGVSLMWHHRHWQKVLENAAGCQFSMLPSPLPKEGTILGGTITLKGKNLSLVCFHGFNFRSKSWAIFTINEPDICFATEAQSSAEGGTCIVEDLTFHVGHDMTQHTCGKNMATIFKLSRGHYMPPTFTSVQEWFHYTFASADINDLNTFPSMQRERVESPTEYKKSRKVQDYSHDREIIFAFPSLQMHLKTKHFQGEREPLAEEQKPVVECSFITEFEDHISVAMNAEVIWFLHDLVSSYIKEKDKSDRNSHSSSSKGLKSPEIERKKLTAPTKVLKQDWRQFECKTWHLEPTVRLVHWASRQIDPIGVDYILQKLGFSHARVTIPKWMQRGFMDPMDKVLSVLVNKLILVLREKPQENEEDT